MNKQERKKLINREQLAVFELLKTFYGKENGISAKSATEYCYGRHTGKLQRWLRHICSAINSNPEIDGLISTSKKIYVCKTKDECDKAIRTTYRTAFSYLKKARLMEKKFGRQGQIEFDDNGKKVKIIYED